MSVDVLTASPPEIAELDMDSARVLTTPRRWDSVTRAGLGRRTRSLVSGRAGKYARHRLVRRAGRDVAVDATLRTAAVHIGRGGQSGVGAGDLRWKIRKHRVPLALVLLVDNSYSLRAEHVIEQAKGFAFRLLEDAAHRGDRLALVAFSGGLPEATVALPLTRSLRLARQRLRHIPLSGRTPLADALRCGRRLLHQERRKHVETVPLLVAVTDGLPTVALRRGGDPVADTLAQARALPQAGIHAVAADATPPGSVDVAQSCAPALAEASHGTYARVEDLTRLAERLKQST